AAQAQLFGDDGFMDADVASLPESPRRNTPVRSDKNFGLYLLALGSLRGVGIATLRRLIEHYGNLDRIWDDDERKIYQLLTEARVKDVHKLVRIIKHESDQLLESAVKTLMKLLDADVRIIAA